MKENTSLIGRVLCNLETAVCNNFELFIGKHEKTVEVLFLMIYVLLQIILAFYVQNIVVTLIIIAFLFFLALERIFVHIWLDYERKRLKSREELIKKEIHNYKQLMLRRIRDY